MPSAVQWPPNPLLVVSLQWLQSWQLASALNSRNMEEMRRLRSSMLGDLGRSIDSYMRSPAFLELMKCSLAALTGPTQSATRIDSTHPAARG